MSDELRKGAGSGPWAGLGRKPVIGLAGGMGSGKTRVAEEFRRHGAWVVAGDPIGHEALTRPEIREAVVRRWGKAVLGGDGEIDRRSLAARVFAERCELAALEGMVFPYIRRRIGEEIARAQADPAARFVVFDAAVMLEAGWDGPCDRLVFVAAPLDVRLDRLARQRGWDRREVEARERAQLPLAEKAARADATIDNSGPASELSRQVEELLGRWGLGDREKG